MHKITNLLRYWFGGIRIYLAFAAVLITLVIWWWAYTLYEGSALQIIRMQELYGWLSILYLALALAIGPLTRLAPRIPGKAIIFDARRALGISAAWFATLHTILVYFKQFQAINPLQLPDSYQRAMLLGVVGLVILFAMTATSVNYVMRSWGVWWFRLHRLVYLAVIVVLLHAFMIGAHAVDTGVLIALGSAAGLWVAMHIAILIRSHHVTIRQMLTISLAILVLAAALTYGLNQHFEQARQAQALQGHGHE